VASVRRRAIKRGESNTLVRQVARGGWRDAAALEKGVPRRRLIASDHWGERVERGVRFRRRGTARVSMQRAVLGSVER